MAGPADAAAAVGMEFLKGALGTPGSSSNTTGVTDFKQDSKSFETSDILSQLQQLLQSTVQANEQKSVDQSTTGSAQTTSLNQASLETIRTAIAGLLEQVNTGVTADAIDFSAIRNQAVQAAIDTGIGDVINIANASGTFANSNQALAAEKLGARAANEGAATEVQARQQQSQLQLSEQQNLLNSIANLFSIEKGAQTTSSTEELLAGLESALSTTQERTRTEQQQEQEQETSGSNTTGGTSNTNSKTSNSGSGILGKLF